MICTDLHLHTLVYISRNRQSVGPSGTNIYISYVLAWAFQCHTRAGACAWKLTYSYVYKNTVFWSNCNRKTYTIGLLPRGCRLFAFDFLFGFSLGGRRVLPSKMHVAVMGSLSTTLHLCPAAHP